MKRLMVLALIGILIGVLSMSCRKEKIVGPTEYDTTIVVDTIPTIVHAYAVSQVFLDPEALAYVDSTLAITITSWTGHYSCFRDATQITQEGNNFRLAGTIVPLFTYEESRYDRPCYIIIEYTDLVLTYKDGDPSDPDNWVWLARLCFGLSAQGISKQQ